MRAIAVRKEKRGRRQQTTKGGPDGKETVDKFLTTKRSKVVKRKVTCLRGTH